MSFIWPVMLLFLLIIPLFVWLYLRMQRRRQQIATRYGSLGLVQTAGRPLGRRRHLPPALFLTGLTILLLALARPQAVISLPRLEGTIILAFDVSGSMAAEDLTPTRMEAAKTAALAFVERQPASVRIGIVAFSDGGLAVLPPTNDQAAIFSAINRLAPERGTSLAQGIFASLDAIFLDPDADQPRLYTNLTPTPSPTPPPVPAGSYSGGAIVLLTDGENTAPPDPLEAVQIAADRGVRIYPIGIGSAEGVNLEVEGFTVHTRLDEATLQQIAELSAGTYYNATDEEELRTIYEQLNPQLVVKTEEMEVTSLLAGVSILLLLSGGIVSLFWFSRMP